MVAINTCIVNVKELMNQVCPEMIENWEWEGSLSIVSVEDILYHSYRLHKDVPGTAYGKCYIPWIPICNTNESNG